MCLSLGPSLTPSISPLISTFLLLSLLPCSCCAHWTGMIASVSGSMRTLFMPGKLNTQFLAPPFFNLLLLPASRLLHLIFFYTASVFPSSEPAHIFFSLPWLSPSLSPSCYLHLPIADSHCPFIAPSLANPTSSIHILSAHVCSTLVVYCARAAVRFLCVYVCVSFCVHTFMREISITVCVWTIWVMYIIPRSTRQ